MGTLLALDPPAPRLRAELDRRFGIAITEAAARRAMSAEIAYYRRHLDAGRNPAGVAGLRRGCAEVLTASLSRAAPGQTMPAIDQMEEVLMASLHFTLYADVRPALTELRSRGLRLVVVSNWDVSLPAVLARLDALPLVDDILTSAEVGARKPAPDIFLRALEVAGAAPEEACHVGDSWAEDVVGAQASGIEAILIERDAGPRFRPDDAGPRSGVAVVSTLTEVTALIKHPAGAE